METLLSQFRNCCLKGNEIVSINLLGSKQQLISSWMKIFEHNMATVHGQPISKSALL